ncbi:unnamed protein product (mitochondrion) [Plasmodiophora brassicae]|uniref:Uncharacterized protein n=1 Tax=Plasmodiophora brassicae TaxID=37360 RepID=A0A3P3YB00_PLABS|nr:unnamed protein product [Plasmodiophora brassicae]
MTDDRLDHAEASVPPTAASPKSASMARLDELIRKTEQIATGNLAGEPTRATKGEESHGRGHGMKTEEQEDADIVQDEIAQDNVGDWPTHFTTQPSCIEGGNMRDYQIEALNWMIGLHDSGLNGILADEMGLGKTLQSISVLGYLKQYRRIPDPHIVIVPKSTLGNWCKEFQKWCPSLRTLRFHAMKDERAELRDTLVQRNFDVVITTYEMAVKEKASLGKIPWHFMYIDEAHRIKNEYSILSQVVRTYSTKHRLLITGTPLQNNLHELWALLNFLLPQLFNSGDDFNEWFSVIESTESSDVIVKRLHRVLRPFLLRRLKTDVEKSLLPKVETILNVGMSAMQREWYTRLLMRDIDALNSTTGIRVRFLNLLMQLRKTCNHPYLFQGAEPGPPFVEGRHIIDNAGKMILLDKLLVRLKDQGSRVLIFSQMTRMLDILEDYMRMRDYQYCRIDGQTNQESREQQMESFNAPNSPQFAFLLSTRAGGLGINLQTADTVILYDSDWNPQMDLQAQDRAHRIGQKKQVHVYRLVTEGTVEEKIVERAYKKLFLDAIVIQQGRLTSQKNRLENRELSEIVRFGADQIFRSKESTITDEDIDAIMQKGKVRTEEMAASLKTNAAFNLANFALSGNKADASIYDFDGENFKEKAASVGGSGFDFIAMPKRDRKQNYDIDDYYRSQLQTGAKARTSITERQFKPSARYDFQFFDVDRIHELEEIQFDAKKRFRILLNDLREAEKAQKIQLKEKEREAKESEDADEEAAPPTGEVSSPEKSESSSAVKDGLRRSSRSSSGAAVEPKDLTQLDRASQIAELERQAGGLTDAQKRELGRLEAAGFGQWKKLDFFNFIRGSELCGRNNIAGIRDIVQTKTLDEVRAYHKVFWQRHRELKDWKKYISQIEKGEARLARLETIRKIIADKVAMHETMHDLTFNYPAGSKTSVMKGYSEDEDRFLFWSMHEIGYENWDEIKASVRRSWMFRFDWFLKSRTTADIAKRCDFLVGLAERELEERRQAELASQRKGKRKAPSSSSKPKRLTAKKSKPAVRKTPAKSSTTKKRARR